MTNQSQAGPDQDLLVRLQGLVSEEMFLLGQELDDALTGQERRRLAELSALLDEAARTVNERRATEP